MNILQINAIYGEKSTGTIMADIGDMIQKNGDYAFYAYQKTCKPVQNGYQVGNSFDWKMHALFARLFGGQGFYSSLATKKLIQQIEKNNIDVIHLHNVHSNFVNVDMLLKYIARKDIATVITLHDCWWFTGKCFHYVDCDCDRFITGCGECPKRKAAPKSIFFDTSAKYWLIKKKRLLAIPRLKIVGCSKWICNEAKKGFLKDCDIAQVYNGIDTSIFKPYNTTDLKEKLKVGDDFIILGMANKWLDKRNTVILRLIYEKTQGVRILLVGCTEKQKAQLAIQFPQIITIGYVSYREELAKYYSMADVFVNLTHADTLPTVNMESICCGTPVITYDSCGSPELVDSDSGIVVAENDTNGILSAIDQVRNHCYVNCSTTGKNRFDRDITYKQYLKLYSDIEQKGDQL